jgi:Skp family chaperone for outer membrane proteins
MPQAKASVLIVRVTDVLDRSKLGQKAAEELRARFVEARKRRESIKDAVEGTRFEIDFARELEGERERRRLELLAKARVHAEAVRKKRDAQVVVDAASVISAVDGIDVTDEVIALLDKAGAKKG